MTALGPYTTTQDPQHGWEALKGKSHKYNAEVDEARAEMLEAWSLYDAMVDRYMAGKCSLADTWGFLADAKNAEQEYNHAWESWQTELYDQLRELDNECTCRPDGGTTCPACKRRAAQNEVEF